MSHCACYVVVMIESELKEYAKNIKEKLESFAGSDKATTVFLSGDLGAGKTTFVKVLAKEFGITEDLMSPTFVILKRYDIKGAVFKNMIHIDAYRLKSYEELVKIKFPEYLSNAENLILIEWPEMVESESLVADLTLKFEHGLLEGERSITIV